MLSSKFQTGYWRTRLNTISNILLHSGWGHAFEPPDHYVAHNGVGKWVPVQSILILPSHSCGLV
jgi:hypothetical protein